ncbi:TonB-linked SusC/RagA family outer membrane protein [Dysgonomonas alginatilytica]|uniref:TonB-linked SusC/RagA family outer membrane protein n=1 Tax=Dysgonomonas alginatilytica TaxID=1605892 RepID=A0A2V3PL90_9BACT|nr:TonB-dependent receptor [Dysgonomonas alginatilytica]PXV59954.1 TonB-linked SusC/RagA family outer membrane protein [Dysgonomonas alginatilytica]
MKKQNLSKKRLSLKWVLGNVVFILFAFPLSGNALVSEDQYDTSARNTESSQQVPMITGVVKDSKGETMPGVSVLIKGTTKGTLTDADGKFSLEASDNSILVFRFLGSITQEIPAGNRKSMEVVLLDDSQNLDEIVVVGYGTMKKRDLTGSVKSIDNQTIKATGEPSTLGAMRGQMAGVNVTQGDGKLGTDFKIIIRGVNSIQKSSNPLVIVDGVIGGDLNALNPSDIEKIDVLKDVSAAAIYGSRGANGVIIVTTKSGKVGRNIITYDGTVGFTTPTNLPRMFNGEEFVAYAKEAIAGGSWHNPLVGFEKDNAEKGNFTDWRDYTLQNGMQTMHTLSGTGGTEKENHVFSIGYVNQTGSVEGERLRRYNAKVGVEVKEGNVTVGLSAYGRFADIDRGSSEAVRSAFRLRPTASPYDENGNEQFFVQAYRPERFTNPLFDARNENTNYRQLNLFTNFFLDYKILDGLNARTAFAPNVYSDRFGYSADTYTKTGAGTKLPKANLTNNNGYSFTWDNTVNYTKLFKKVHNINAMVGTSMYKSGHESAFIAVKDLPYNSKWHNIGSAGAVESRSSSENKQSLLSFMARVNYTYNDKYLFTFTGRADGSSKLAEGNKWGFFPSAAVAWRISEEGFLKEYRNIDDLKIRISYGESGNNVVDPYSTILGVSNTQYDFGGTNANGQYLNRIANDKLGWERSKEINLGIDYSFFSSRISGTIDFYSKDNIDLILAQKIPQTNGFTDVSAVNIGQTRNTGLEISLNTVNIQTKDFTWSTVFNFATNKNQVLEIFGNHKDYPDQNLFIGKPVQVHYDYDWNGIWQLGEEKEAAKYSRLPGAVKEVDQNGDGLMTPEYDKIIRGTPFPDWTGSVGSTFIYKDLDLAIFAYTRQGEMKRSSFHAELSNEYLGEINQLKVNYWTPENPSNEFYRPGTNAGNKELLLYRDCSFVRISNITLGYNVPLKWIKNVHMSKLRVYASAINPFLFTNYTGLDPEFDNTSTYNGSVSVSTYMLGVNVAF